MPKTSIAHTREWKYKRRTFNKVTLIYSVRHYLNLPCEFVITYVKRKKLTTRLISGKQYAEVFFKRAAKYKNHRDYNLLAAECALKGRGVNAAQIFELRKERHES